jgi:hypothetical protein
VWETSWILSHRMQPVHQTVHGYDGVLLVPAQDLGGTLVAAWRCLRCLVSWPPPPPERVLCMVHLQKLRGSSKWQGTHYCMLCM